ncbi:MAG: hypothetical protein U5L09_22295 [Bacteroidales bacterium]|nr:hypothetical protein [Bacteroidales bacterium]
MNVSTSGTLSLSNTNLAHSSQNYLKTNKPENSIELIIKGEIDYFDEAIIALNPQSDFTKDRFDAAKLFSLNTESPLIYLFTNDDKKVAFNNIPQINENTAMFVGILIPNEGTYSIELTESQSRFY